MSNDKVATTLTIDRQIKQDFKIECIRNGVEMGETVQTMMHQYIQASRELHNERNEKENG